MTDFILIIFILVAGYIGGIITGIFIRSLFDFVERFYKEKGE